MMKVQIQVKTEVLPKVEGEQLGIKILSQLFKTYGIEVDPPYIEYLVRSISMNKINIGDLFQSWMEIYEEKTKMQSIVEEQDENEILEVDSEMTILNPNEKIIEKTSKIIQDVEVVTLKIVNTVTNQNRIVHFKLKPSIELTQIKPKTTNEIKPKILDEIKPITVEAKSSLLQFTDKKTTIDSNPVQLNKEKIPVAEDMEESSEENEESENRKKILNTFKISDAIVESIIKAEKVENYKSVLDLIKNYFIFLRQQIDLPSKERIVMKKCSAEFEQNIKKHTVEEITAHINGLFNDIDPLLVEYKTRKIILYYKTTIRRVAKNFFKIDDMKTIKILYTQYKEKEE